MKAALTAVRASRLSDEVAQQLEAAIRRDEFVPGERLPSEKWLSERFEVSRVVIREAMSRLKSDGLVESRQGLGAFVTAEPGKALFRLDCLQTNAANLRDIYQLRIAVEGAAAGLAAQAATDAELSDMRRALDAIDAEIRKGHDGIEPDNRFHAIIARASRNPYFDRFLAFIGANLREAIAHARTNTRSNHPGSIELVQQEHEAVMTALLRRDAAAAEAAMRVHLTNALERLALKQGKTESLNAEV